MSNNDEIQEAIESAKHMCSVLEKRLDELPGEISLDEARLLEGLPRISLSETLAMEKGVFLGKGNDGFVFQSPDGSRAVKIFRHTRLSTECAEKITFMGNFMDSTFTQSDCPPDLLSSLRQFHKEDIDTLTDSSMDPTDNIMLEVGGRIFGCGITDMIDPMIELVFQEDTLVGFTMPLYSKADGWHSRNISLASRQEDVDALLSQNFLRLDTVGENLMINQDTGEEMLIDVSIDYDFSWLLIATEAERNVIVGGMRNRKF